MDPFSISTGIVGLVAVALKLVVGTLGLIDKTAAAYDEAADELEDLQQDLEQLQTQMVRIHGALDVLTSNTKDRGFKKLLRNDHGQAAIQDLCKALEATLNTLTQMTDKMNEDELRPAPLPSDKRSLEFVRAVFKHSITPSRITDLVKALREMRSDVQTCFTKLEATFQYVHTLYDMMSNGLARSTSRASTSTNLTVRIKLATWLKGWEGTWGPFSRREPISLRAFLQSQHVTVAGNSHMTDDPVAGNSHMTDDLVAGNMSKMDPAHLTKLDRRSTIQLQAARKPTELQEKTIAGFEDPGMDALRGGFGAMGSIIRARSVRKMSMSGGPPDAERHRSADHLMPGVQRHQLWDAPVPHPRPSDSVERISMQPPRQHHRSIRFGDEPMEGLGKEPESSIQSPSTPSQRHGSLVPPTASQVANSNLTSSPPAMRYDGLPPISSTVVSPFEVTDPCKDDTKTARPVDYNSPSLECPSSDSLDYRQAKSPYAHLYPWSASEESLSLVANHDAIRLVKRI